MILDAQNTFSDAQAVTASAASTNIIDTAASRDIGAGEPMELIVICTETVTASGSATVTVQLRTDTASNMGSAQVVAQTDAIGKASLTAGTEVFRIKLPRGLKRYIDLYYSVGTGPLTAGKFTAALSWGRQDTATYPAGYSN